MKQKNIKAYEAIGLWDFSEENVYLQLEKSFRKTLFERSLKKTRLKDLKLSVKGNPEYFYIKLWQYKTGKVTIPFKIIKYLINRPVKKCLLRLLMLLLIGIL